MLSETYALIMPLKELLNIKKPKAKRYTRNRKKFTSWY